MVEILKCGGQDLKQRIEDLKQRIANLINNIWENGIMVEILKCGGQDLKQRIANLINNIWENERLPLAWHNAIASPNKKSIDESLEI
ncbi:hypothetical protein QE152_g25647 [Popillia japonica]|uniref:Uncharacterized protein n=1 Tax=Popillia japonica TaxID=7064 RepID=A0AAW1K1C0_POPJA